MGFCSNLLLHFISATDVLSAECAVKSLAVFLEKFAVFLDISFMDIAASSTAKNTVKLKRINMRKKLYYSLRVHRSNIEKGSVHLVITKLQSFLNDLILYIY